ncbi:hypothetical protein PHYPSEUDO_008410 [Phytophthora pseudosyringae]|uniref:LisH domain-containing protein n=1 Tax=Phytophthora pseudosyringae TaxID=221518 RepID=A0A8T1W8H8_9STRA|nr:hypothetical protein PHYPSEUDO_008410 [Phytophthora pseudosyringae]
MTEIPAAADESATASELEQHNTQLKLECVNEGGPQDEEENSNVPTSTPMDKLKAFAVQLLEEFLTQHKLEDTLAALQAELERKGIPRPGDHLWFEMHRSCRVALARSGSTTGSTLEKLVAFCAWPNATRALSVIAPPVTLSLASPQPGSVSKLKQTSFSLKQAQSQMLSPVVRPSQRQQHRGTPSSTPAAGAGRHAKSETKGEQSNVASLSELNMGSGILQQNERPSSSSVAATLAPVETKHQSSSSSKKHKPKKKRNHGGSGTDSNNKAKFQLHPHPLRTEGSMAMAYDEQIKRDLSSGRLLARELRVLRVERATYDSLRRGTASLEAALARHDPYAKELVRERYGFIHRVECALCTVAFLPVNLPHRVSFKCIMDLHELWGYRPPQRELAARYRPPLCYDPVSVCRMCGPILFEHTTATPNVYDEQLSPTMARARSLSALTTTSSSSKVVSPQTKARSPVADAERRTFCSDPYALPPLFGDDVLEDGDSYAGEEMTNEVRGNGPGAVQESPAKAIVYSQQQTNTAAFMSSKEWEIINPSRSTIRQTMENTVK